MSLVNALQVNTNKKIIFVEVNYVDPTDLTAKKKWFSTYPLDIPNDLVSGDLIPCEDRLDNKIPLFLRAVDEIENKVIIKGTYNIKIDDPDNSFTAFFTNNVFSNMAINFYLTVTPLDTFEYIQLAKAKITDIEIEDSGDIKINFDEYTDFEKDLLPFFEEMAYQYQKSSDETVYKPKFFGKAIGKKIECVNDNSSDWIDSGYTVTLNKSSTRAFPLYITFSNSTLLQEFLFLHKLGEDIKIENEDGISVILPTDSAFWAELNSGNYNCPANSILIELIEGSRRVQWETLPWPNCKVYIKAAENKNFKNEFFFADNVDLAETEFNVISVKESNSTSSVRILKTDYQQIINNIELNEVVTVYGTDEWDQVIYNDFKFLGAVADANPLYTEIILNHKMGENLKKIITDGVNTAKIQFKSIKRIKVLQEDRYYDAYNYRNLTKFTFKRYTTPSPDWEHGGEAFYNGIKDINASGSLVVQDLTYSWVIPADHVGDESNKIWIEYIDNPLLTTPYTPTWSTSTYSGGRKFTCSMSSGNTTATQIRLAFESANYPFTYGVTVNTSGTGSNTQTSQGLTKFVGGFAERTWLYFEMTDEDSTGPYNKVRMAKIKLERADSAYVGGDLDDASADGCLYLGSILVPNNLGDNNTAYDDLNDQFKAIFQQDGFSALDYRIYFNGTDNKKTVTGLEDFVIEIMSCRHMNLEYARDVSQKDYTTYTTLRLMNPVIVSNQPPSNYVTQTYDAHNGLAWTIDDGRIILDKAHISVKNFNPRSVNNQGYEYNYSTTLYFGSGTTVISYIDWGNLSGSNRLYLQRKWGPTFLSSTSDAWDELGELPNNSPCYSAFIDNNGYLAEAYILENTDYDYTESSVDITVLRLVVNSTASLSSNYNGSLSHIYNNRRITDRMRFYTLTDITEAYVYYYPKQLLIGQTIKLMLDQFEFDNYVQQDLDDLDELFPDETCAIYLDKPVLFYKALQQTLQSYNIYSFQDKDGNFRFKYFDFKNINDLDPVFTIDQFDLENYKLKTKERKASQLKVTWGKIDFEDQSTEDIVTDPLLDAIFSITNFTKEIAIDTNLNSSIDDFYNVYFKYFKVIELVEFTTDLSIGQIDIGDPINFINFDRLDSTNIYIVSSVENNGLELKITAFRAIDPRPDLI